MATTLRTGSLDLLCQINFFHEGEREEDSIEDHQSEVVTVFENGEYSNSENTWNDDSESKTEI